MCSQKAGLWLHKICRENRVECLLDKIPVDTCSVKLLLTTVSCGLHVQRSHEPSRVKTGIVRRMQSTATPERRHSGHSRTVSVDVAELPDTSSQAGAGYEPSGRPATMVPSNMTFAVPEEDSSASAGSPTVVVPPGDDDKSPFNLPSDNVPLMDQSESTSESDLEAIQSLTPRRVPAR